MATQLDLQEQEQLDELKAFWKRWGNLITWLVVAAAGAYAAWNGWNTWQRNQAAKAGALYDQLETAVQAGDVERSTRAFDDLRERFGRTAYAEQGGLATAKVQLDKGRADAALVTLAWVADNATEDEYRAIARLRAAGVLLDKKQFDEALKQLDAVKAPPFDALVADRRGDVLSAQGKPDEARKAWQRAYQKMDATLEYRRLVDAKLTAAGASPSAAASGATP